MCVQMHTFGSVLLICIVTGVLELLEGTHSSSLLSECDSIRQKLTGCLSDIEELREKHQMLRNRINQMHSQISNHDGNGSTKEGNKKERMLYIYETQDLDVISEFERDLIRHRPSDLVIIQTFHSHDTLQIPESAVQHPRYPQYNRVISQFGRYSGITSVILDFFLCFKLRADGTRFDYDPESMALWLKHIISELSKHKETMHYFKAFTEYLYSLRSHSDLDENEKEMLLYMDVLDVTVRNQLQTTRLILIKQSLDLFENVSSLRIAAQLVRYTVTRILEDQISCRLNKWSKSLTDFLNADNARDVMNVLSSWISNYKEHVDNALDSLMIFAYNHNQENEENNTVIRDDDVTTALQWVNGLHFINKQWNVRTMMLDLTQIIADWTSVPELNPYAMHWTKIDIKGNERWGEVDWQIFREMNRDNNITMVRYRIRRLYNDGSKILFNKYQVRIATE